MSLRAIAALLITLLAWPAVAGEGHLAVRLTGVQHERGMLRLSLYAEPKTFRKEAEALAVRQLPARPGAVTFEFGPLPPGRYALMAYHDEDGNGVLNRRLGMFPTEGYGLSNNPQVLGPPGFDDSAFELPADGTPTTIDVELRY
jgi:uncharacterized protein (DUF2141 family)